MTKFKISQIQFQAKDTPNDNAALLFKLYTKAKKFNPDLICTPECSNLITHDKNIYLNLQLIKMNAPLLKNQKVLQKKIK